MCRLKFRYYTHKHLDYNITAKTVAQSASFVLGYLSWKLKPLRIFTRLWVYCEFHNKLQFGALQNILVSTRYSTELVDISHDMRFPTMWYVRPAKPQTSLGIRAVWSESLLVAWIVYEYLATGRTAFGVSKLKRRLHRLIWVYTCQKTTLLEITCRGSFILGVTMCTPNANVEGDMGCTPM